MAPKIGGIGESGLIAAKFLKWGEKKTGTWDTHISILYIFKFDWVTLSMVWCVNCAQDKPTKDVDGKICCSFCGKVLEEDNFSIEPTFVKNASGHTVCFMV